MKYLLTIITLTLPFSFFAQDFIKPYPEFGFTAGYTFGGGLQYGFNIEAKTGYQFQNNTRQTMGLEYQFQFQTVRLRYKTYTHRLTHFRLVYDYNNQLRGKIGKARIRNPWGLGGNRNICLIKGLSYALEAGSNNTWIGYQEIRYKIRNWAWFDRPYRSILFRYTYSSDWGEPTNDKSVNH